MLRTVTTPPSPRLALATVAAAAALLALGACGPASPSNAGADAQRGRLLVEQFQCGRCHVIPGVAGARGNVAVTLEGFGARSYIAGRFANRPEALAAWLVDPPLLVPGTAMPKLGVDAAQARHMAAYLASLR